MSNLPRHHIQTRRAGRGLLVVVILLVAAAVSLAAASFVLAGFNEVAAALASGLPGGALKCP